MLVHCIIVWMATDFTDHGRGSASLKPLLVTQTHILTDILIYRVLICLSTVLFFYNVVIHLCLLAVCVVLLFFLETETERDRQRGRERDTETVEQRDRDRGRQRQRLRWRDRQTERERETRIRNRRHPGGPETRTATYMRDTGLNIWVRRTTNDEEEEEETDTDRQRR